MRGLLWAMTILGCSWLGPEPPPPASLPGPYDGLRVPTYAGTIEPDEGSVNIRMIEPGLSYRRWMAEAEVGLEADGWRIAEIQAVPSGSWVTYTKGDQTLDVVCGGREGKLTANLEFVTD